MITQRSITVLAAAALSVTAVECARRDVVLGERGGILAPTAGDNAAAVGGSQIGMGTDIATATAGRREPGAGSGASVTAGTASTSAPGITVQAGAAAPTSPIAQAGRGGVLADAGAPITVAHPSSGCGRDPVQSTTIQVNGMTASYIIDLPSTYEKTRAYPLIMAYRDAGITADSFRDTLKLAPIIGDDAIAVYLNCLDDASSWELQRDVMLFDSLLVKLEAGYCVDKDRIFALGHGSGAVFASLVGCVRSDQLRAIAPLSGAPPPPGPCVSETAVWMLQGDADTSTLGPGRGNRDFWASQNACDLTMPVPVDPSPCEEYAGCQMNYPVRYCEYDGDSTLPAFAVPAVWTFFQSL